MTDRRREIQELREKIAEVDVRIRGNLDARARLSKQIHGLAETELIPETSEQEWLGRILTGPADGMPEESLRTIFRAIRSAGRAIEQPARVAVAGPEGGFCHQAALETFGVTAHMIECGTADSAFSEVIRGRAAFAVFALELSVEGVVHSVLSTLAETDLVLIGERVLDATYELMSLARDTANLEKVYLTAAAHAACQQFLDRELPRVTIIDVRSPQVAAELSREAETSAAILPEPCGLKAGLGVLVKNVGDLVDAKCRYAIAGQRPATRTGNDVSCLLFGTDNQPGALYDVLRHFAERGINLRKLQTLPVKRGGLEYYFYAEINGHASDRPVVMAIEAVKRSVQYFRLLGSFPSGV